MANNYTPGPWHVGGKASVPIVYDAAGYAIADARTYHGRHAEGEASANARLMAEAPAMADELACIFEDDDGDGHISRESLERIRAIFARIKGEA